MAALSSRSCQCCRRIFLHERNRDKRRGYRGKLEKRTALLRSKNDLQLAWHRSSSLRQPSSRPILEPQVRNSQEDRFGRTNRRRPSGSRLCDLARHSDSGWCPKGRKAEDGPLATKYLLTETPSSSYPQRMEWNVRVGQLRDRTDINEEDLAAAMRKIQLRSAR